MAEKEVTVAPAADTEGVSPLEEGRGEEDSATFGDENDVFSTVTEVSSRMLASLRVIAFDIPPARFSKGSVAVGGYMEMGRREPGGFGRFFVM